MQTANPGSAMPPQNPNPSTNPRRWPLWTAAAFLVLAAACGSPLSSAVARWESRYNDSRLGPVTPEGLL